METYSFGEWLKQRREQLNLTQRELAATVHCSVETIKKIEADECDPMGHHRDYFLTFVESAEYELFGVNQLDWLNRLETELGNVRAAIGWSIESGDVTAALRQTGSLYWFWSMRGYHHEGYG